MNAPDVPGRKCPRKHCYAPHVSCALGEDLSDCPEFALQAEAATPLQAEETTGALPWTGLGLGADDVATVAAVGRPSTIALVGAPSAGKTTILATAFLALRRGESLGGYRFAGSFTLLGWQIVSSYLEWPPHGRGGFPPHTAAADVRSPCLLHLRLLDADGRVRELLLSDMPGEWFTTWSINSNEGEGAVWLATHADGFIVVADREALGSPQRGRARGDYEALARRVHSVAAGRYVLPVVSKADIPIPEPVMASIARLNSSLFSSEGMPISVGEPDRSPLKAVNTVVERVLRRKSLETAAETGMPTRDDPLLAYRSLSLIGEGARNVVT